jgi:hypothetical protein
VPYVDVSRTTVEASDTGVVVHDPERAFDGYNFYCERRKGSAFVMDMEGRVVHRWTYRPTVDDYAIMLPNGDLAVVVKHTAIVRIDWESEEIWRKRVRAHHDIVQASDGSFYTIVEENKDHRGLNILFDGILHLTEDGDEIGRWSSYDHLDELKEALDTRSFLDTVLDRVISQKQVTEENRAMVQKELARRFGSFDYFHMNTISLLPENPMGYEDDRFAKGHLLVCFRNVNQIAILSNDTYRILWVWGEGQLQWPHHPTMLDNGHILIFDNGVQRGYSRVIQIDPVTEEVVWEYRAEPAGDFFSSFRGSAQRLPNGNTLICESDEGRVFEVTPDGEIVWTWLNPDIRRQHRRSLYRWMRWPKAGVDRLLFSE